jgi:hypothetical protein
VAQDQCCPGEKKCGGGCISADSCCTHTERQCPDGTCVPITGGCCDADECGDCGTCVGGSCVEVPGICDDDNCERCNFSTGTCEPRCTGMFGVCCNGQCWASGFGSFTPCGTTCCSSQFNQTCCEDTTCCPATPCYECAGGSCRYKCEGFDSCDKDGVCKNCDPTTGCGG